MLFEQKKDRKPLVDNIKDKMKSGRWGKSSDMANAAIHSMEANIDGINIRIGKLNSYFTLARTEGMKKLKILATKKTAAEKDAPQKKSQPLSLLEQIRQKATTKGSLEQRKAVAKKLEIRIEKRKQKILSEESLLSKMQKGVEEFKVKMHQSGKKIPQFKDIQDLIFGPDEITIDDIEFALERAEKYGLESANEYKKLRSHYDSLKSKKDQILETDFVTDLLTIIADAKEGAANTVSQAETLLQIETKLQKSKLYKKLAELVKKIKGKEVRVDGEVEFDHAQTELVEKIKTADVLLRDKGDLEKKLINQVHVLAYFINRHSARFKDTSITQYEQTLRTDLKKFRSDATDEKLKKKIQTLYGFLREKVLAAKIGFEEVI